MRHPRSTYTYIVALTAGAVSLGIPAVGYAAAPHNLAELANLLAHLFNSGAVFLVAVAFIIYMGGVTAFVYRKGAGEVASKEFRNLIIWGIIGLFVMVSVWGIVRLVQETLFGKSSGGSTNSTTQAPPQQLNFPNSSVLF